MDQDDQSEVQVARSLLDQLLVDSRLYHTSKEYLDLLGFVVRLRNIAPFNALLLQIQKPGLSHAASAHDWRMRFGRTIKKDARPLVILWPFGPVAFVYDILDTEGDPLPQDVAAFFARGAVDARTLASFDRRLYKKGIEWTWFDAGDRQAGSISVVRRAETPSERTTYRMAINRNHDTNVQFSTVAHELAHLFLGHLGADTHLNIPGRPPADHAQEELEAESVAYIVCARNEVQCRSATYLAKFVQRNTTVDHIDLYQIMRAAGQVESLLGLTGHITYERPVVNQPQAGNPAASTARLISADSRTPWTS